MRKAPTWAIILCVLMCLMGGCGSLSHFNEINYRSQLAFQQEIMDNMNSNSEFEEMQDSIASTFDEIINPSEYQIRWTINFGYIGFIVSALFIFGGIFLLVIKPFSIKLAYAALFFSIGVSILKAIIMIGFYESSLISNFASFGNFFSIGLDFVLLIILYTGSKEVYDFTQDYHNQYQ